MSGDLEVTPLEEVTKAQGNRNILSVLTLSTCDHSMFNSRPNGKQSKKYDTL